MANFLDDLSIYNAKAAAAISLAVTQGDSPKANLMSSLKTTANDITLSDAVRLNSLTALINVGSLLDVPLPPYFPVVSTFANSQTYVGVHNDLSGLNVGDYQHLTSAEKAAALNKASLSDITFANLIGVYTDNASLVSGFATKQNALSGTGYVKASGGTITYDNSTFLTAVTGIVAADTPGGGQLTGTYASPVLSNAAVIAKVLTGFNPSAPTGVISSTDSIISAIQKLNANVNSLAASGGTINEITFSLPSSVFSYTAGPFTSGAVPLSGTFVNQSQNRFFAGPSSGGSGQPTFRAIVPGDFPASGATAGTYGSSSSIPVVQVDAYGRVTNISSVASASGGQVNTITYSVPAGVFTSTVTGTTAVGITLGLSTQTANRVWAGPASGAAATPGFRSLVAADIPSIAISQVTSLQSELDSKMNYLLNAGEIWIGNASNAPTNKSLTGDVTMTINGVVTIENEAVTFAKMQNITSGNLLGRWDASTPGPIQQISLSADFDLDSGTGILSLAVPVAPILNSKGGLITYRQSIGQQVQLTAVFDGNLLITDSAEDDGLKWVTAQGDIEVDGALDGTFNITAGAVTLAKMATLAANSFIGNNTGSSATPIALSVTQATAMLNQFTTSAKGLVPAASFTPTPPYTLADYFLNANGGWSLGGSGGGGTTTFPLTIGTGLSGTSATFDGSAAVTVSLNTSNANTWNALQTFHSNIYLGEASGAAGSARFLGSTSGYVVLQAAASPDNQIYTLPTAYPASNTGYFLTSTTGGVLSWDVAMVYPGAGIPNSTGTAWGTSYSTTGTGTVVALQSSPNIYEPQFGNTATNGHAHFRKAGGASPTGINNYATLFFQEQAGNKRMAVIFDTDAFQSEFLFAATTSTKTYTFPNSSGTVTLNPMTAVGDIIYGGTVAGGIAPPTRLPIGTANQVLAVSAGLIPEWKTIAAGGDVTGPAGPVIDGNFAVFDSTTGKIIKESAGASLSAAGVAVFNSSVTVGVSASTTGQLIFRNATTSATTTFQSSTSQSANLNYTWPQSAPTVGQILSSDASGNLSWTAAGAGNMVLASTQTNTGAKTFNSGTLILAGSTSGTTVLNSGAAAGSSVLTLPVATSTLACLGLAQTFTAAQTFQANTTIGGGSYNATLLDFTGTTSNRINFSATPATAPVTNVTPSAGTRIVIANTASGISGSANSIGFNTGEMWLNNDLNGAISFYNNTTRVARFTLNYLEILTSGATIRLEGATSNTIRFNTNGSGAPAYSSSGDISLGTRIIFYPIVSGGANSYAMGVNGTNLWTAGATSYTWYGNSNSIWVTIDGNGISTTNLAAFNLINTVATSVNFAGAATALTIGATTGTATIRNAILNLSNISGQLQINSTKVVGTRITGYGTPTGGNRTLSFAAITQAEQVLAQLVADLKTHGLIS